jgi:hypothetical protein
MGFYVRITNIPHSLVVPQLVPAPVRNACQPDVESFIELTPWAIVKTARVMVR